MQAIKEKLNDMSKMRKAKAEAKQEEKEERELAKSRLEVAHEVRLAREAEAAMDLHVNKAATKVVEHETKYLKQGGGGGGGGDQEYGYMDDPYNYGGNPYNSPAAGYSTDTTYGISTIESVGGQNNSYAYGCDTNSAATTGTGYPAGNRSRGPPPSNNLL